MIFKWIHCKVHSEKRNYFSDAQSKWGSMCDTPGFIGQFGGWDLNDIESACIISLWKDQSSFNYFMNNIHDSIIKDSGQAMTYYECNVDFFDPVIPMPGKYRDIVSAIPEGNFLRVADCIVKSDKISHFKDVQKKIWIPEMQDVRGMMGGQFSVKFDENRYLVTTLWDTEGNHTEYANQKIPLLRKKADVSNDLETIIGRIIKLEPSWLVLPTN